MGDDEIQEASMTAHIGAGMSTYLHGIQYDVGKYKKELKEIVDYIKKHS